MIPAFLCGDLGRHDDLDRFINQPFGVKFADRTGDAGTGIL